MKKKLKILGVVLLIILVTWAGYMVYEALRPRTREEKIAEIIHLEDKRRLTERLESYLESSEPELRQRAALAIGRIGGKGSGRLLLGLLADSSYDVAITAAFAMGLTGEKEYASQLLDRANDLPSAIAAEAVEAAGRLADSSMKDVAEALSQFLTHPSPDVREAACYALFRAGAKSQGSALIKFLKDEPDDYVRKAALYTLARQKNPSAKKIYVGFLADADPFARSLAVRGLGAVPSKDATHYLAIALNDSDPGVVAQAITELAKKNTPEARKQLAEKLENEHDDNLVILLLSALQQQKNQAALATARTIVETNPPPPIAAAGMTYLTTLLKDRAVNLIDSLTAEGGVMIRAAAADAFGIIKTRNVISRLAMLFNDEDPVVRRHALTALLTVDPTNRDFYLRRALNDPDYTLNVAALEHIKQKQLESYLPVMQTMMSRGEEIDVDVRRALVETAAAFLKADSLEETAKQILSAGLVDPEYVVSREAAEFWQELFGIDKADVITPPKTRYGKRKIASALKRYGYNPHATIVTDKGEIEVELFFDVAPLTVLNFIELAESGFYNELTFHRVVPNFVVQGGDPRGDGWGGPAYFIRDEYSDEPFERGTVGMATSGRDTGGSQFFITLSPQPHLEGRYTVFGRVLSGMETVDQIIPGDVIETILISEESK